jgi:hypothetical protein
MRENSPEDKLFGAIDRLYATIDKLNALLVESIKREKIQTAALEDIVDCSSLTEAQYLAKKTLEKGDEVK